MARGLVSAMADVAAAVGTQLAYPVTRARRREERFAFRGQLLPYTFSRYNNTYRNERSVEISIAKWFLAGSPGRMLEVGNVLAHYGVRGHTVVDKYEATPGVLNEDIVDFVPHRPFDTVVTISTLEHVGWDETPREPDKVFQAIDAVLNCLRDGGRMLVTVPIGHNKALDAGLRDGVSSHRRVGWCGPVGGTFGVKPTGTRHWPRSTADRSATPTGSTSA